LITSNANTASWSRQSGRADAPSTVIQATQRGQPLTLACCFQRHSIRQMEWGWVNFDTALLMHPQQKTWKRRIKKISRPHLVPGTTKHWPG
jgi:hypothetical protein